MSQNLDEQFDDFIRHAMRNEPEMAPISRLSERAIGLAKSSRKNRRSVNSHDAVRSVIQRSLKLATVVAALAILSILIAGGVAVEHSLQPQSFSAWSIGADQYSSSGDRSGDGFAIAVIAISIILISIVLHSMLDAFASEPLYWKAVRYQTTRSTQ